ncbi:hypothetical protein DPMN_171651 [Dreissena polymorpha]|uniref:Uncharacterized protein n=1 Tax=Dreissena polymorpha TaxID=45954 RepID=A0A9D4E0R2_DREPO|nr:hypothetical protein DPMN_171651 [Dreissena polymorpha]
MNDSQQHTTDLTRGGFLYRRPSFPPGLIMMMMLMMMMNIGDAAAADDDDDDDHDHDDVDHDDEDDDDDDDDDDGDDDDDLPDLSTIGYTNIISLIMHRICVLL